MAHEELITKHLKKHFTEYNEELHGLALDRLGIFNAMQDIIDELINTPEMADFLEGLKIESVHQTERWGAEQEESKYPHDYALVLDRLKGKLAVDIWNNDAEKYKHHLITIAAVCFNAHRQISKPGTRLNAFFNPTKDA